MEYDFELVYISRKKNGHANALSRHPDHDTREDNNKQLVVLPPKFFSQVYARMTKTGAYQSVQNKVKQDQQENQASILQIKKWTNTHQLIKLNSIWLERQIRPACCCQRQQSEEGGNSLLPRFPTSWTPGNFKHIRIGKTGLLVAKHETICGTICQRMCHVSSKQSKH
jgi:hypothetical protein